MKTEPDFIREPSVGDSAAARSLLWVKALFDRSAALLGLLVLCPFLLAVALMIRLDSPGPALYRQKRYGRDGHVFFIYKFRTMTQEAGRQSFRQAQPGDARITRLGAVLRSTSIDELPQLLNVLMGQMSLVGPRPHPIALDDRYAEFIPNYMLRYRMRPGMTGLAQISGQRGRTPTVEAMAQRVALDLEYVNRWSLGLDLRILLNTPLKMFGPGAHDRD